MKKNIFTPIIVILVCVISSFMHSCNYLDIDQYINDMQSLDTVFQKKGLTEKFLYNVYSYLPTPGKSWSEDNSASNPWILCSDEAFSTLDDGANKFSNNIFSSDIDAYRKWKRYYEGIRNASIFIKRAHECKELSSIELKEYLGEATFLKAYFYFELMKQYGPVCIVPNEGFTLEQPIDEILIPRSSWDECVKYVDDMLKEAASDLPSTRSAAEFGKPTSGAANAVRARLLLYSASPLFNGNTSYADFVDKKGNFYINQNYDEKKWALAACAAKEIIDGNQYSLNIVQANNKTAQLPINVTSDPDFYNDYPSGAKGIDTYLSYADMFNGQISASQNHEIIFGMPGVNIDTYCAPLKMYGESRYNITQSLVNAYLMCNGKTTDESANDPDYPYVTDRSDKETSFSGYSIPAYVYGHFLNREMRFYATVGFNNSFYFGYSSTNNDMKNFQAEFHRNGNCTYDDPNNQFLSDPKKCCMTGYLCRKFQNPEDCFSSSYGSKKSKVWIEYRLAEVYLNYIEAINELTQEYIIDDKLIKRDAQEIKTLFNLIRHRAGLPGISLNEAQDVSKVRDLIKRERQVEFAWEGLRYFDVRRWKIASEVENGNVIGMSVNKDDWDNSFYRITSVREVPYAYKAFTRRKNFWPIPLSEITKNSNLVQNPGWE